MATSQIVDYSVSSTGAWGGGGGGGVRRVRGRGSLMKNKTATINPDFMTSWGMEAGDIMGAWRLVTSWGMEAGDIMGHGGW